MGMWAAGTGLSSTKEEALDLVVVPSIPRAGLEELVWCRGLTCAVVDIKEAAVDAQQLVGDHSVYILICIQGQDGPIEHREGGPWARRRSVTPGQPAPTLPPPQPDPVSHG